MAENESIAQVYSVISKKSELLHEFAELVTAYSGSNRDYGTGVQITMVEIHLLTTIEENPGITVTELAVIKHKTPGAISQIIKKLENRGYIFRRPHEVHGKKMCFFPTDEGKLLSELHKQYDVRTISNTVDTLLERCGMDEVDTFFKVMEIYRDILIQRKN